MRVPTTGPGPDLVRIVCNSVGVLAPPKTGLCEFHPPVSKGGYVAGTAEGVHLGQLRVHSSGVCSRHELQKHRFALFFRQLVDHALYVLWTQC